MIHCGIQAGIQCAVDLSRYFTAGSPGHFPFNLADWQLWSPDAWKMFEPELSIGEKMLRPVLVYLFLIVVLRIFGKRELAQLNPFDLVVLLSLSNTVQNAIIGNDNSLTGGLLGAFTLLLINYIVVRFVFRHRRLDQLMEGSPTTLIDRGRVKRKALAGELMSESELITVIHRQGFAGIDDVEKCVIEPGGIFYVEGKQPGAEDRRHGELLAKLEELSRAIDSLKSQAKPS